MKQMRWEDFKARHAKSFVVYADDRPRDRPTERFDLIRRFCAAVGIPGDMSFRPTEQAIEVAFARVDDAKRIAGRIGAEPVERAGPPGTEWAFAFNREIGERMRELLPVKQMSPQPSKVGRGPKKRDAI